MQQPPNYYGNSYPPNMGPQGPNQNFGNNPYMTKPDYPTPGGKPDKVPAPPSYQNTTDNDYDSVLNEKDLGDREVTVYATFPDSAVWHDRVFKGRVIKVQPDALTLYSKDTNSFTIVISVYINFIEFTDKAILEEPVPGARRN